MSIGDKFSEEQEAYYRRKEHDSMSEYIRASIVVPEAYKAAVVRLRKAKRAVEAEMDEEAKMLNIIRNRDTKAWPEYEAARTAFYVEQDNLHNKIEEGSK